MSLQRFIDLGTGLRARLGISFALVLTGLTLAHGQEGALSLDGGNTDWQRYNWLKPSALGDGFSASVGQDLKDPNAVLTSGSLWQQKYGAVYTRPVGDMLSLSCETSAVTVGDGPSPFMPLGSDTGDDLSRQEKVGVQFQPVSELTLRGSIYESTSDTALPSETALTSGTTFFAEGHLPYNSTLTLNLNSSRTGMDNNSTYTMAYDSYDAQLQQPIGKLPLTAVFKGHYEQTAVSGSPTERLPSLEQSLVWKPLQDTTLQMGLRQQQYQEYPGITDQLNEALFADWSQTLAQDVSWHSYAEVLNSHALLDQAPASPIASGANGTAQATGPGSNSGMSSAMPVSFDDQTVTFSTGPSFKLQQDISASIEYSNRWDTNPSEGGVGQEQRVSVSVKGSF